MKYYKLNAIIDNKEKEYKLFISRKDANNYLCKLLDKYNLEVEEVICKNNNHNIEFYCDGYNRIFINREKIL